MRTIKFRGFTDCLVQDKWVYGFLSEENKIRKTTSLIDYEVDKASIGQFTGLYDKNGTEIYEGDILAHDYGDYSLIVYREECMAFCRVDAKDVGNINGYFNLSEHAWRSCLQRAEVIGNQYENPELLNYKEED
ncbi:putative prophage Lp2 protein 26 [Capnocytophaga ochracea DSM 7271]|uniref:Putative prophage Lp2 protein 26 n=1 Tax=Capnocytophaga ochracea (strain ATCC 27872 / DSM 7271 / CCUG 9716 / JCM 12966 / NCTC 12371 / SS31 / VPI 2845) TaxID=521097 RepID=C7M994_CAPOD|nr:YopX family protein [Capnocytophaga ochracea]ACU92440.1 putative prophage Lp2 protein 26 [Capnocytophaga ochracea DSM 7271]UAK51178.1 YopX family protein [Capnocytophaga ochracea]